MKLLIVTHLETSKKPAPHTPGLRTLTRVQVKKIKAVAPKMEIIVTGEPDEIERHAADANIIVTSPRTLPPLAHATHLTWLHSLSAGVDRILTPEVKKSSVIVSNSSGVHAVPIAEHVMAYLLIFARGFLHSLENQKHRLWKRGEGMTELYEKTVLIVGMGNIGSEVARRAHAFDCHIIALTRSGKTDSKYVHEIHKASALERMLKKADFVVSCLPGTPETHHIFDRKKFGLMKPSAYFINIGRGSLVHEKDLIAALKKKLIAGAALDVAETEPLPAESPLWNMQNVIITPHHSGASERYMDRAIDRFVLNLKAYLRKKPLPNLVDKTLGY
ncbi:D-2-hydroxyacid dehydrogenase [Candidatus Kaiserbacteria bacterium]|nr:D-2-hydroxyacid dehydrogenase [Candidatus Kaiserbacteria bacterium]